MSAGYDKRLLRRRFERTAVRSDAASGLAREVGARMAERLELLRMVPDRILDLGSGSGHDARMLRRRYTSAWVVECDFSRAQLARERPRAHWWRRTVERWGGGSRARVCADMESLPFAEGSFDMVWSNLALQWLQDPQRALAEVQRVLRPGGVCLFSTLGPDTLQELRACYLAADAHVHVHRMIDMHDYGDMMVAARFADPVMDMECLTLTYGDVPALLAELKVAGGGNADPGRAQGMTGRGAHRRMLDAYEALRRDGRIPATFEVVYGHAWRPQPRPSGEARAVVRFHPAAPRSGR